MEGQQNQSNSIGALARALAKAQAEIVGAHKNSNNPFFNSSYADLASIYDAIRDPLSKNELSVIQTSNVMENRTFIVTTLCHSSGEWIKGLMPVVADKPGPQALGSAITYARRYALSAIVGVPQIDDDAETATVHSKGPVVPPPVKQKAKPMPTANGNKTPSCKLCGSDMRMAKSGNMFYCPNFKDGKGEHQTVNVGEL